MNSISEIDISGLSGSATERQNVALELRTVCEGLGFLRIHGHGIDEALIENAQNVSREFFRLPAEEKDYIARKPPRFRGYLGFGTEGLGRIAGVGAPDLKEAFSMGPVDVPTRLYHSTPEAKEHFEFNRWPDRPANFRPVMEEYYRAMMALSSRLMAGFALALNLSEDWFEDKIDRQISNIRINYYPAQNVDSASDKIRAGAHTDFGSLTILLTEEGSSGLQVRGFDDNWIDIPHQPGRFVVNIGDLMAQWTNDRFVSTKHRVCNPKSDDGSDRLSIAFFQQPNYDAMIECLPTCTQPGQKPRYEPVTSGAHRRAKLDFATTEQKHES